MLNRIISSATIGIAVSVLAATLPVAQHAPTAGCSGFSPEIQEGSPPLDWAFRACGLEVKQEVNLRFRNKGKEAVRFQYSLWFESPGNCRNAREPEGTGVVALGTRESTPWPYQRHAIPAGKAFNGRIWVCVSGAEGIAAL